MSTYPELNEPTFSLENNDIYMSLIGSDKNKLKVQNAVLRIIDIDNNYLTLEFVPESNTTYGKLLEITDHYRNEMVTNSTNWFGTSMNSTRLRNMFCNNVELPKSIPGYPTIKVCITDKTKFVGSGRKKISLDTLILGMYIDIMITIDSIIYHQDRCYLNYILDRIKFVKNE